MPGIFYAEITLDANDGSGLMDGTRHVIDTHYESSLLILMASYDVARTIHHSLVTGRARCR